MANVTANNFTISAICEICQTSYGFSSNDRRSIIVMVVLTGIALISCYVSVLWYSIRTRYISDDKLPIVTGNVHTNEAFDDNYTDTYERQNEDMENKVSITNHSAVIEPVVFTVENEKERY